MVHFQRVTGGVEVSSASWILNNNAGAVLVSVQFLFEEGRDTVVVTLSYIHNYFMCVFSQTN